MSLTSKGDASKSSLDGPQVETTKSLRRNADIDALAVEPDVLVRIRRWILGVAIVDFDVDDGPVITGIYPPLVISPAEAENIAFSAFPDSPQFEDGSQDHSFRIRQSSTLPDDRPVSKDGFIYGFAHFTQRKDASSKRGYEQRSLVILTYHPYPALFARITALLGPLFQQHGLPMLEAACHNMGTWPDPTPGTTIELGFLGAVLSIELPYSPEQQQLAVKVSSPPPPLHPPPLLLFEAALPHLWSLWECLVLSEPLLVFGASPAQTSQAVWWLRDLLRPLPLTGDIRPYFTIHDTDHAVLAGRLPPAAGRILGVTNPVFERACAHWPHVLSLGRNLPLNTATHGASAGNTRARAGPAPGWKTRTHMRYVSKDRALLRRLEDMCASGSERERLDASLDLRRHFHARTTEMLVPLSRYLHTLIPTPTERASASASTLTVASTSAASSSKTTTSTASSSSFKTTASSSKTTEPLRMRAFSAPAFLASLKTGAALPFRSTARRKEFYERWLRTPAFGVWLGMQEGIVQGVLDGG
ncbi:hypothetical protein B0H12DRAFT_1095877 [Mycena haematopus]|nr:hypothetical protein B0H12DRAFT_1095877 [Mycena haematopus]